MKMPISRSSALPTWVALAGLIAAPIAGAAVLPGAAATAEPDAYALLKDASEHRSVWAPGITGLTADIAVNWNGVAYAGKVKYTFADDASVTLPPAAGKEVTDWAEENLDNLLSHRGGGDFSKGDGRYPITFAPDDGSPLGRKVVLHDRLNSSYRVHDHEIQEVDRVMGTIRLVITMLDFVHPDANHYLPKNYGVTIFDAKTGKVTESDFYSDDFQNIDGNWVPASRRIVTAQDGGKFVTHSVTLSNVTLLR